MSLLLERYQNACSQRYGNETAGLRITSIDIIMSGLMNQCIESRWSRIMNDQISARNLNTIVLLGVLIQFH